MLVLTMQRHTIPDLKTFSHLLLKTFHQPTQTPTLKRRQSVEAIAAELCMPARMADRKKLFAVVGHKDMVSRSYSVAWGL